MQQAETFLARQNDGILLDEALEWGPLCFVPPYRERMACDFVGISPFRRYRWSERVRQAGQRACWTDFPTAWGWGVGLDERERARLTVAGIGNRAFSLRIGRLDSHGIYAGRDGSRKRGNNS